VGAPASTAEALDFRFYVHDVRLVRADGGEAAVTLTQDGVWQSGGVALLDFEDRSGGCANGTVETNGAIRGTAPAGTYTGVKFRLGVPFALNHANAAVAASPLNLSSLWWGWNGGYKFLRVDLRAAGADPGIFNIHVGSTGCTGDPGSGGVKACSNPNLAEITLAPFDVDHDSVVADLGALLATTNVAANLGGSPGCMSELADPECAALFPRLGIDPGNGAPMAGQVFLRKQ
jgi:uncharacterized repeat protein (TIGR04052 family)